MKVIIACEFSGVVRDAFARLGHDATSCDLLPSVSKGKHLEGDIRNARLDKYDLMIAHPSCTYLCSSGLHWNKRVGGRQRKTYEALEFVKWLMHVPIERIAIENPVGCISTEIRKADQYVQPYDFGEDASKKTGLWLKNLPLLMPTKRVPGRLVEHKGKLVERWSNQTDSGQNKLAPSTDRWKLRAETYLGIAEAMAAQWGCL